MKETNSFRVYDSTFSASTITDERQRSLRHYQQGDWPSYKAALELLKSEGFVRHDDPWMRGHFISLNATHHAGSRGDVHFHSEIYFTGFKFEFYQDVVLDNRNGGRFSFDKMGKAPYLWRKRVELLHTKLATMLAKRGFEDHCDPVLETAYEQIFERQRKTMEWHFSSFYGPVSPYNGKDQDGVLLQGGETRCFYTHNGRLQRGRVYRDINNVWPILLNRNEWTCEATFELFTYDPTKHPRKVSLKSLVRISAALRRAVEKRDFKRAARIQEALDRMAKHHDMKPGDKVFVENPRYHGPGIVDYVKPPFFVGVKVGAKGDGNLWAYEWPTVRPAIAT